MERIDIPLEEENTILHIYFKDISSIKTLKLILEYRKEFSGPYSCRIDPQRIPSGQKHLHVFYNKNQLFALNWDGSAHDNSHQNRIPNKLQKELKRAFPDLSLPDGGFIEAIELSYDSPTQMLIEDATIDISVKDVLELKEKFDEVYGDDY